MKKSILKLGNALNKAEQQKLFGGRRFFCPNGNQALVACINGEFVGFCITGTITIAPYCP